MKKFSLALVLLLPLLQCNLVQAIFDTLPQEFFLRETLNQNFTRLEMRTGPGEAAGSIEYNILKQTYTFRDDKGQIDSLAKVSSRRQSYGFRSLKIKMTDAGGFNIGVIEQFPEESYLLIKDRRGDTIAYVDQSTQQGLQFVVKDANNRELVKIERAYLGWVREGDTWRVRSIPSIDTRLFRPLLFLAAVTTRRDYYKKTSEFYSSALKHSKKYAFEAFQKSVRHTPILTKIEADYNYDNMKYQYHRDYERGLFLKKFNLKLNKFTREELGALKIQQEQKLQKEMADAGISAPELQQHALGAGLLESEIDKKSLEMERILTEKKLYVSELEKYLQKNDDVSTNSASAAYVAGFQRLISVREEQYARLDQELNPIREALALSRADLGARSPEALNYIKKFAYLERAFVTLNESYDSEKYFANFFGLGEQFTLSDLRVAREKKIAAAVKAGEPMPEVLRKTKEAESYLQRFFLDREEILARQERLKQAAGVDQKKLQRIDNHFNALLKADRDVVLRDYYLRMLKLSPAASRDEVRSAAGKLLQKANEPGTDPQLREFHRDEVEQGRDHLLTYFENHPEVEKANRNRSWGSKLYTYFFKGFGKDIKYDSNPGIDLEYEEMDDDTSDL